MDPINYLYIALAVCVVAYVGLFTFKVIRKKKRKKAEAIHEQKVKDNLDVVDGVRYTMEENPVETVVTADGVEEEKVNITFLHNDFTLAQNTPYEVSANGELKPGKYIVLTTDENQEAFYIRVGIYVREYHHNQEIVLAEGDTICAVSGAVILR